MIAVVTLGVVDAQYDFVTHPMDCLLSSCVFTFPELSGVESDTALTTSGRKSLLVRRMKDVLEENKQLRATVDALKDRLSRTETEVGYHRNT